MATAVPIDTSPCRASAKQKVANSWANRRKSTINKNDDAAVVDKNAEKDESALSIPVCRVVRNAWEQLAFDVSRRLQTYRSNSKERTAAPSHPRVFPSVVSVLQASAVSSQVVETFGTHSDKEVMNILPADYDWQQAIQSFTLQRHRAFLLLDLSAVCKACIELQQWFGHGVELQYSVQHNRDSKLLELCCRLGVALRTNSSMDVEAATHAQQQQQHSLKRLIVDDAGATRKPNGYIRKFLKQGSRFAVDGPDEVQRIQDTCQRLLERRRQHQQQDKDSSEHDDQSLTFMLRLPRQCTEWETLVQATIQACNETESRLVGVSVCLQEIGDDYLEQIREALDSIAPLFADTPMMHVDVTGAVSKDVAPFLAELAKSYKVSVDASTLLVEHAGALCTRIIGVKEAGETRHLYIDDGCYGSLYRDWANTDAQDRVPLPLLNTRSSKTQTTTVWGPTCDGLDRVCKNAILPQMQVDEWLVFPDMGLASGKGTSFNGIDPPDVAYVVLGYFRRLQ